MINEIEFTKRMQENSIILDNISVVLKKARIVLLACMAAVGVNVVILLALIWRSI